MKKVLSIVNNRQLYKISYLILSIYFTIQVISNNPISSILSKFMILWGMFLLLHEIFINKFKSYTKSHLLLLIFVIINIISLSVNINKGENIKILVVVMLEFFVLFTMDTIKRKEEIYFDIYICSIVFLIISSLGTSISLILYVLKNKFGIAYFNIMVEGKFSGIFSNGNTLGILALISIMISVILISLINNRFYKLLLCINCVIQLYAIYVTATRSAMLGAIIYIISVLILKLEKRKIINSIFVLLIISAVATVFIILKSKLNLYVILTGRYEIWIEASRLLKNYFLLGIGDFNIVPMLKHTSKLPLLGIEYGGLHNIYFQIILANGIFALVIILTWVIYTFARFIKEIEHSNPRDKKAITYIVPMLISILAINTFESNLVYIVSFIGFIFWIFLGYVYSIVCIKSSGYYID